MTQNVGSWWVNNGLDGLSGYCWTHDHGDSAVQEAGSMVNVLVKGSDMQWAYLRDTTPGAKNDNEMFNISETADCLAATPVVIDDTTTETIPPEERRQAVLYPDGHGDADTNHASKNTESDAFGAQQEHPNEKKKAGAAAPARIATDLLAENHIHGNIVYPVWPHIAIPASGVGLSFAISGYRYRITRGPTPVDADHRQSVLSCGQDRPREDGHIHWLGKA